MVAAKEVDSEGIRVEVVNLRMLEPLESDSILQSVRKTGKAVVV